MTSKKKEAAAAAAASSSDSSSSNTSSSSSTSSTSSGSDSSSSDSDNSSTSANKSAAVSTDSDSKKKTAPAKKKVNPPPANKTKTETKNEPVASSEVVPPQKNVKEKVVPKSKQIAQQKVSAVYSSESDDGNANTKTNTKRKSPTKPKASATVTPVTKTARPAPRVLAKKPVAVVKSNTKASNVKDTKSKIEAQKKSKTKSIFSPDNSSESDGHNATPPPPKLTAMKTVATSKAAAAIKAKPKGKKESMSTSDKSRASSVSSNSSQGSGASSGSSSDSDSSGGESATTSRVKTASSPAKSRCVGRPRKTPPAAASASAASAPDQGSGSEPPVAASAILTRKLTRSVSARGRSKHLTGRTASDSESEAESKSTLTKSPVKKGAGPKGPASQRKPKGARGSAESGQSLLNEVRKCPVDGCDSSGHLCGKLDKHFTIEACPVYHNRTPQACKEAVIERKKREEERKKAIAMLKPTHASNPTPEQKAYRQKVKELKSVHEEGSSGSERERNNNNNNNPNKEKEPLLYKFAPKYDLKMFQEAQAIVSESIEEELSKLPSTKGTKYIEMGKFEMEVWYQSPYPDDYARLPKLYLCEYCLRYMKSRAILNRHAVKCVWRHPPGEEVYRKDKISVWEVDGKRYKPYSQNLCLLAKFFLDHKTLYYDVEPFLFYVMTINDNEGCHTVGYFSKEKNSFLNYNVSCILTLPPYQRQGYGRLLIDFSYLLTRVEGKIGSPEKPLSDLGLISYRSYWKDVLLEYLCNLGGKQLSVKDISQEMAINSYDIVSTLQALGMMKYWKGKHIILKKQDVIEEYVERSKKRGLVYKEIDPSCLRWTPFVPPSPSTAS
ncbi:histone acetyltransferase KAT7 [Nilaparvata lugens]|uniref:histone acetyltransferase KAT7 n=1 Tax=Nilaparvata lugens TaxID=108931 RepID=UPI00193EAA90|nr:histone acetyltransferase KAT7 [Nilaparvata lugens]